MIRSTSGLSHKRKTLMEEEKTKAIIYIKGSNDRTKKLIRRILKEMRNAGITVKVKTPQPGNPEDEERFK